MKSEKAKDKLDYNRCHVCDGVLEDGHRVGCDELTYYSVAIEAIEIAENEMVDKAVKQHQILCPCIDDFGTCNNIDEEQYLNKCDGNCDYVRHFKEYMK